MSTGMVYCRNWELSLKNHIILASGPAAISSVAVFSNFVRISIQTLKASSKCIKTLYHEL